MSQHLRVHIPFEENLNLVYSPHISNLQLPIWNSAYIEPTSVTYNCLYGTLASEDSHTYVLCEYQDTPAQTFTHILHRERQRQKQKKDCYNSQVEMN
ncbi:mCG147928 [Mus musculus]|nr:mCG147928 [Mus musculus]